MEENKGKEIDYQTQEHPFYLKNKPKTIFQAIISGRNRLVINALFGSGLRKCTSANFEIYHKEKNDKVPLEDKKFKSLDEVDLHCMIQVNNIIIKNFAKFEWEMFDCLETCEKSFPSDYYDYIDFNIFYRIPCNRRCEDQFNEKARPVCAELNKGFETYDFTQLKKKI